jgi:hypothetical protein
MVDRITRSRLDKELEYLNMVSKKMYIIEEAYGKVRLAVCLNGKDTRNGISDITPLMTKSELFYTLKTIWRYIVTESNTEIKSKES